MLYIPGEATACVNLVSVCKFFKQDRYLDRYFSQCPLASKEAEKVFFFNIGENNFNNSVVSKEMLL